MKRMATNRKRLLQYLQGNVLGFCWRFSEASEAARGPPALPR